MNTTSNRVKKLNDAFRQTLRGGTVLMTAGVVALGEALQQQILEHVRNYRDFDTDNDPYGEHDFGGFEIDEHEFLFKIDYYDLTRATHSRDPAEPAVTERVLTIMLASEY